VKFAPPGAPNAGQNERPEWFVEQWQNEKLHTVWPAKAMQKGLKVLLPFPQWNER
jgi:hypothetical protein